LVFYYTADEPTILEGTECSIHFIMRTDDDGNDSYRITSSDESVIKVFDDRLVALSTGKAEIIVYSESNVVFSDSRVFTVIKNDDDYTKPANLNFTLSDHELDVGETLTVLYTTNPINSPYGSYYYRLTNEAVISYDGIKITALSPGECYVNFFRTKDDTYFAGFQIIVTE